MSSPAARVGDNHVCPMCTGDTPHVGGPISGPGSSTVLIEGIPAALQGDMCTCNGPPDAVAAGSSGVYIDGVPAARMGDPCSHGGVIVGGAGTVFIGEAGGGGGGGSGAESEAEALEMEEKDYLEIDLKDKNGNPVPYAEYIVTLPDGTTEEGRLNGDGYAYFKTDEPGDCTVSFPQYTEEHWNQP